MVRAGVRTGVDAPTRTLPCSMAWSASCGVQGADSPAAGAHVRAASHASLASHMAGDQVESCPGSAVMMALMLCILGKLTRISRRTRSVTGHYCLVQLAHNRVAALQMHQTRQLPSWLKIGPQHTSYKPRHNQRRLHTDNKFYGRQGHGCNSCQCMAFVQPCTNTYL